MDGTGPSRSIRLDRLKTELGKAWQENIDATKAFNAIMNDVPPKTEA